MTLCKAPEDLPQVRILEMIRCVQQVRHRTGCQSPCRPRRLWWGLPACVSRTHLHANLVDAPLAEGIDEIPGQKTRPRRPGRRIQIERQPSFVQTDIQAVFPHGFGQPGMHRRQQTELPLALLKKLPERSVVPQQVADVCEWSAHPQSYLFHSDQQQR